MNIYFFYVQLSTVRLFLSPILVFSLNNLDSGSFPSSLSACTGEASSGRPGFRGQQHDKDHRVWPLRVGHLVPLSLPGGIRPFGEALHVRVLLEVHEEPDHSAQTHGAANLFFLTQASIYRSSKMIFVTCVSGVGAKTGGFV